MPKAKRRNFEWKPEYDTKKEARKAALTLLDRGFTVKMRKVGTKWSVGVY